MKNADMPAFPLFYEQKEDGDIVETGKAFGLTKREHFAGLTMQAARIANPSTQSESLAHDAIKDADALIDALAKHQPDDEITKLKNEINRLMRVTHNCGADSLSEDDVIAEGRNFGDWEAGFDAAITVIENRIFGR